MPTERKIANVEEMREWMASCTIAISTDFTGMGVTAMSDLRRALREQGVHLQVVKNRLARIAAAQAGRGHIAEIVDGPTALAYGFDEPTDPARALAGYIRANRPPLTIRGGVMGDRSLSAQEVGTLATLPTRDEMIARLASRIQSPITALANVLQGPASGLVRVLHQASQNMQTDAQ